MEHNGGARLPALVSRLGRRDDGVRTAVVLARDSLSHEATSRLMSKGEPGTGGVSFNRRS